MKETLHLLLDEYEDNPFHIGLLSLVKKIPEHEFFFQVNQINSFNLRRVDDLVYTSQYFSYKFAVYKSYSKEHKSNFMFISNRSIESKQIKPIKELFVNEQEVKYLLNNYKEAEFIIKTSDAYPDFSVLLMPKNGTFAIKEYQVEHHEELYKILYYE